MLTVKNLTYGIEGREILAQVQTHFRKGRMTAIADYSNGVRNDDDFQQKVAAIKGNPQLANVTAVKENHFVKVKLSEITPGVRTVDALVRMAEEIHGISVK